MRETICREPLIIIGYDKELYIIVEKYLALTERMDMCMYMYKNQTKAITYIEKMSAI